MYIKSYQIVKLLDLSDKNIKANSIADCQIPLIHS
ncbi:MAG: hypothetical protein JWQ66_3517 [Mucilaginibacter sp.]|nr:hypothetical protein [Mucilaginibacter sp.]